MPISAPEADMLSALEHEKESLMEPQLYNLLKKRAVNPTAQECYDYVESLHRKGLVHANFVRAFEGRAFSHLRITGEGRATLRAVRGDE